MKKYLKTNNFFILFIFISIGIPFVIACKNVFSGSIPFWYDPARDLLLAIANLKKFTLIGPPSGIPGVFYGPYWIWLLSLGELFSKDPRWVVMLVLTVPYFTIVPFILFRWAKILGKDVVILLWLLFIFSFGNYATFLWNPHLAPLLFFVFIYLIVFTNQYEKKLFVYIKTTLTGIVAGLICNFHISFGIGLIIGSVLFFVIYSIFIVQKRKKSRIFIALQTFSLLSIFSLGIFVTFLPFFAFELRHNFSQTQKLIEAIVSPYAVVGQTGLSKGEILQEYFGRFATLLQINIQVGLLVLLVAFLYAVYHFKKNKNLFSDVEKKLLLLLATISTIVLVIYFRTKNPVWNYHFICFEIIYLFILGVFVRKFLLFRNLLLVWVIYLVFLQLIYFFNGLTDNPYKVSSLATKEYVVDILVKDASKHSYAVFAYSSAIYTYDYDYLFMWKEKKTLATSASDVVYNNRYVYLIIEKTSEEKKDDFINYKTPNSVYTTVRSWNIADGTSIIKRGKTL